MEGILNRKKLSLRMLHSNFLLKTYAPVTEIVPCQILKERITYRVPIWQYMVTNPNAAGIVTWNAVRSYTIPDRGCSGWPVPYLGTTGSIHSMFLETGVTILCRSRCSKSCGIMSIICAQDVLTLRFALFVKCQSFILTKIARFSCRINFPNLRINLSS